MNKKISILGYGWLGKPIGMNFTSNGHEVKISTTSPLKQIEYINSNINSFIIDINKSIYSKSFFQTQTLIIAITPQLPENYKVLIQHIEDSPIENVLFISSTSVYAPSKDIITEESELLESKLLKIERLFCESKSFNTTILRFGGLFGENRHPGLFFKNKRVLANPLHKVNMICLSDCVNIIRKIIVKNIWDETFNACSPTHPTKGEFYSMAAENIGEDKPIFGDNNLKGKTISSDKLIKALNYQFICSDLLSIWNKEQV